MEPFERYILFGPPASGKGTQGRRLAGERKIPYLSTGALLRSEMKSESALGKKAKVFLDQGQYLPDDLIIPIVMSWLEKNPHGWVLDGFPRTVPQAQAMQVEITRAISLEAPYAELERRVSGRVECVACHFAGNVDSLDENARCPQCHGTMQPRADDDLENFRSRYAQYEKLTQPLGEFYESRGVLARIDAVGPPHEVFARVVDALM